MPDDTAPYSARPAMEPGGPVRFSHGIFGEIKEDTPCDCPEDSIKYGTCSRGVGESAYDYTSDADYEEFGLTARPDVFTARMEKAQKQRWEVRRKAEERRRNRLTATGSGG